MTSSGTDGRFPAARAPLAASVDDIDRLVVACRACPRLVAWREEVAATRRAAFATEVYWGRAVPGFGPADAPIVIVGLAPAAHGANRTGRMFTGDRSGDVLVAALHRAGLASQPTSTAVDDGLVLRGVRMTAPVHCAPPANRPTPAERDTCAPYLVRELELMTPGVVVALGAFGWGATIDALASGGWSIARPRPRFAHGGEVTIVHDPVGPPADAARLLPRQPAEHVHRATDPGDARRRAGACGRPVGRRGAR